MVCLYEIVRMINSMEMAMEMGMDSPK